MTVNILEYDFFYKSVKFELWADNRREIKQKIPTDLWAKAIDKIIITMFLDQRWILGLFTYQNRDFKIVDYLD